MGENHGGTQTQNAGVMSHLPPRYHLWTPHAETAEVTSRKHETGKRDALKGARPVWRGAVGKGSAMTPSWLPTLQKSGRGGGRTSCSSSGDQTPEESPRNACRAHFHRTSASVCKTFPPSVQRLQQAYREQRLARYEQVIALRKLGMSHAALPSGWALVKAPSATGWL